MCYKITDPLDAAKHLLSWALSDIQSITELIQKEVDLLYPTVQHIIDDKCWGDKLIDLLALVHPVVDFAEKEFPEHATLIEWINSIVDDIARFKPLHSSQCTCGAK